MLRFLRRRRHHAAKHQEHERDSKIVKARLAELERRLRNNVLRDMQDIELRRERGDA